MNCADYDNDPACDICQMDTGDYVCSACRKFVCCDCVRTCIECRTELCPKCATAVQISDGIQDDFCPAHKPAQAA